MLIQRHCARIKSLENVTPKNQADKGHVQNNDIYQLYDLSAKYFQRDQWSQQVVALIREVKTIKNDKK